MKEAIRVEDSHPQAGMQVKNLRVKAKSASGFRKARIWIGSIRIKVSIIRVLGRGRSASRSAVKTLVLSSILISVGVRVGCPGSILISSSVADFLVLGAIILMSSSILFPPSC